jgi:parallel beta-helix repeat protein
MTRFKLLLVVASACVFMLGVQELQAATLTYIVGTCKAGTRFTTIQGALNASPAPDIVQVCPGIYAEQITISKPVTLQGLLIGDDASVTITPPPAGLTTNATINGSSPAAAHIFVKNATGAVTLTNLIVDDTNNKVMSGVFLLGVFYQQSPGTVNHVVTFNQQAPSGGWGIYVEGGPSNPTVTVENCNVQFFNLGGIYIVGPNGPTDIAGQESHSSEVTSSELTAKVLNNYVDGQSGEFDILLGSSTTDTVTGNIVSGGVFGITVDANAGSISGNTIVGTEDGIVLEGDGATLEGNKIFKTGIDGIDVDTDVKLSQITGNIIVEDSSDGVELNCHTTGSPNVVHSNTFEQVKVAYDDVPSGFAGSNTYIGVILEIGGSCTADAPRKSKPAILKQSPRGPREE